MPKIDEIYAFIAEDSGPEDEGIAAFVSKGWAMPMVAADKARVDSLREMARYIAKATGKPIKLIRFSVREEVEVFSAN